MVRSKNPSRPVRDTDPRKARAQAAMASKSNTGPQRDDDTDPSMPIFFYMPHEFPYGIFCQWQKSFFTVPKSSFAYLDRNALPGRNTQQAGVEKLPQNFASTTLTGSSASPAENTAQQKPKEETMTFGCCEQYMMYCKALYFQDAASATRILSTSNPKEQKAIGRSVKGFSDHEWSLIRQKVGEEGNYAKFTQDPQMQKVLLSTGPRTICEAARRDDIWGIGMDEATAIATWNALGTQAEESWGQNLLGKAIMAVRERILREMAGEKGQTTEEMVEEQVKTEKEKRVRGLKKRLRDIEVLKEKRDKGEKLQPNQIEKIEKEGTLRRELEELSGEVV